MRYLLDTHTLLWAANEPAKISGLVTEILQDGSLQIYVSAASAWEIATKVRLGKLADPSALLAGFEARIKEQAFSGLSITIAHSVQAGAFLQQHKDPFDRILAAQALLEQLTLLSADPQLDAFGIHRLW